MRELIGSGGMANVYKAVMLGHNGPVPAGTVVAVKVLRQEYMHCLLYTSPLKPARRSMTRLKFTVS